MMRSRMFKLTGILVLFTVCGCVYKGGAVYVGDANQPVWQPVREHLVSSKQLADSDLEILWQDELPIKHGETLDKLIILGNRIYALSSRNFLIALNRDSGSFIFSRALTNPDFPVVGFDLYQNELFTIEGGKLLEMNPDSGANISVTPLAFTVACPPVRNSSFFYVSGTDGHIRAFRAADMIKMFEVGAPDNSAITSIVADEEFVIFTTDSGLCISFAANASKYLWQFDAEGGIVGPLAKNGDSVFFASKDTYVYRLEAATGKFIWKCPMGERLQQGPDATAKCVYQHSRNKGLAAIDRASGKILWRLPEAKQLIAEAGDKAYLASGVDGIIMADIVNGKQQSGIGIPGVSKYAVNVIDSKIYIADDMGRIACLKPTK
jgi:outer membrane protein assembly factor BamB